MAEMAKWGKLVFSVSSERQLTFSSMEREVESRWQEHHVPGGRPRSEFLGMEAASVELECEFSAHRGIKPRQQLEALEASCASGEVNPLYVGGKRVGAGPMYVAKVSSDWGEVWNQGELVRVSVDITFKEYG